MFVCYGAKDSVLVKFSHCFHVKQVTIKLKHEHNRKNDAILSAHDE